MFKDRGNKKWTSLTLTEHPKELEKILEYERDVDMPLLDEQKLEELVRVLEETIRSNKLVKITYYNSKRYSKVTGIIKVNNNNIVVGENRIPLQNIIDMTLS